MNKTIKITLLFCILISFVFAQNTSHTKHVLFLGNSYTYVNALPTITAALALSTGDTLIYDSNTPGGYTLQQHSVDATSLAKIAVGNWDYVVLQEQSQLPSFPDNQVDSMVFPYAKRLDSIIHANNNCAVTMFYMTWGKKHGDASNCSFFPPLCTYEGNDSLLHLRYMMMADSNNAVVSAVGAVWHYIIHADTAMELYQTDQSHPSLLGSYAGACSFYTAIFGKDPTLITNDYTLNSTDASFIRNAAKTVVYDSLLHWHIGQYTPCDSVTSIKNNKHITNFSYTPNPVNDVLNISSDLFLNEEYFITIKNTLGQTIYTNTNLHTTSKSIDFTSYPKGMYIISISNNKGEITCKKIIK